MKVGPAVANAALATALIAATFAQPGSATAADLTPALQKVVDAANVEGRLNLSWSQSSLGGSEGAERFERAMNEMFGSKVDIRFTPGPSMPRVGHQLATEYSAGQKAFTDVYLANAAYLAPLVERDLFVQVDWKGLLPSRIDDKVVENEGRFLRLGTGLTGVTYNSQLAPFEPKRLADFLKPEWKGKIASTPYAAGFDTLSATDIWGPERTVEYVKKLSDQITGLMRCGEMERIATGEYIALVMDCTGQDALVWQERGAPLQQMVPRDAGQQRYYYLSIPKNSAHPNAAKLFTTFMATHKGQSIVWDTWKIDLHHYEGSQMAKEINSLENEGVKFTEVTVEWVLKHPETGETKKKLIEILSTKK